MHGKGCRNCHRITYVRSTMTPPPLLPPGWGWPERTCRERLAHVTRAGSEVNHARFHAPFAAPPSFSPAVRLHFALGASDRPRRRSASSRQHPGTPSQSTPHAFAGRPRPGADRATRCRSPAPPSAMNVTSHAAPAALPWIVSYVPRRPSMPQPNPSTIPIMQSTAGAESRGDTKMMARGVGGARRAGHPRQGGSLPAFGIRERRMA
jgi:hypothetical protein